MTLATGSATAETQESRIVVISSAQTTPMIRRLQQEIEALGFSVQIENRAFAERPEVELSSRGAVAAIEVVTTTPGFIALYVLEPKTARIIRQELPIEAPKDPASTELVTTRAVELLRAARLPVSERPKPPAVRTPPKAPKAMEQPLQQGSRAQLHLGVGTGLSYVPHWRVGSSLGIGATYFGHSGLGWVGSVSGTMTAAKITLPELGTIEASPVSFRVGGALQAFRESPVGLRLSSGIEFSQLKLTGRVSTPYVGSTVYVSTFAPWFAVGTSIRFASQFQLVTQLSGSWSTSRTVVRVAGEEMRDWGRPTLSGTLYLEWRAL